MSKELFHISLTTEPLAAPSLPIDELSGSQIIFSGIVRGTENGEAISGIDYSAYEPMAKQVMQSLADEGRSTYSRHGLWLEHRIGFVPAGEPSLNLVVTTPHSSEGFEISRWYLEQIKTRVPIWKKPIYASGVEASLENGR
jgi:molybdopterin synthase catalytic subunit